MADAMVSIGRALTLLGNRLSAIHDEDTGDGDGAAVERAVPGVELPRGGLGPRQLTVLVLGGPRHRDGPGGG